MKHVYSFIYFMRDIEVDRKYEEVLEYNWE